MTTSDRTAIKIVFGAMTFGEEGREQSSVHDPEVAEAILDAFTRHGHNEIDTARTYGEGTSETMLGQLNWQSRGLVMDSKYFPSVGRPVPEGWNPNLRHTPGMLRENLMKSLNALKTDKLNVWYLHAPDRTTPYQVTMGAVNELYEEGYFTRLGISNYPAWEVAQICELCRSKGWKLPDVYQGVYNALHRAVEPELFPCLRNYGIAFYGYNPLAGGYLTARYHRDDQSVDAKSRFNPDQWQGKLYRKKYWVDEFFDALEILRPVVKKHGITEAEAALRWMMHHSQLKRDQGDACIIGASSTKQIEENMVNFEKGPLPAEVVEALDKGWQCSRGISHLYWV